MSFGAKRRLSNDRILAINDKKQRNKDKKQGRNKMFLKFTIKVVKNQRFWAKISLFCVGFWLRLVAETLVCLKNWFFSKMVKNVKFKLAPCFFNGFFGIFGKMFVKITKWRFLVCVLLKLYRIFLLIFEFKTAKFVKNTRFSLLFCLFF